MKKEELHYKTEIKKSYAVMDLEGFMNIDTADEINLVLEDIIKKNQIKKFIFNIEKLEFISSAGVGVLMDLYEKLKDKNGKICFIKMSTEVIRVFNLVGFLQYFGNCQSIDEALIFIEEKG